MIEIPDIIAKVDELYLKGQKNYPCHVNRASGLGYSVPELEGCLRKGVYERTAWDKKEYWPLEMLRIFEEGNRQEIHIMEDLAKAGYPVIEAQSSFQWKEYQITGHIDGKFIFETPDGPVSIPCEIKSMSPHVFDSIHNLDDFKQYSWTRTYLVQITLYMLMTNTDQAVFILKNKSTGQLKQINVLLDYELGEWALKAAEAINKHIEEETLPDQIENVEVCADCKFKTHCKPGGRFGPELRMEDDPQLESRIDAHLAGKDQANDHKKNWDLAKTALKNTALDQGGQLNVSLGKYLLTGKISKTGRFTPKIELL